MSHREHADGHGDDRQPLLPKQDDVRQRPRATGLPWGQVIVLAIWRSTHVCLRLSPLCSVTLEADLHLAGAIFRFPSHMASEPLCAITCLLRTLFAKSPHSSKQDNTISAVKPARDRNQRGTSSRMDRISILIGRIDGPCSCFLSKRFLGSETHCDMWYSLCFNRHNRLRLHENDTYIGGYQMLCWLLHCFPACVST